MVQPDGSFLVEIIAYSKKKIIVVSCARLVGWMHTDAHFIFILICLLRPSNQIQSVVFQMNHRI